MPYGQYSRYPSYWLGLSPGKITQVDTHGLGGKYQMYLNNKKNNLIKGPLTFLKILDKIHNADQISISMPGVLNKEKPRVNKVYGFFIDYFETLDHFYKILLPNGMLCIIIGNRTVRKIRVPTHQITREYCESLGFTTVRSIDRKIPSKTLPRKNSPNNKTGDIGDTITNEKILIFKKIVQITKEL